MLEAAAASCLYQLQKKTRRTQEMRRQDAEGAAAAALSLQLVGIFAGGTEGFSDIAVGCLEICPHTHFKKPSVVHAGP